MVKQTEDVKMEVCVVFNSRNYFFGNYENFVLFELRISIQISTPKMLHSVTSFHRSGVMLERPLDTND